jgi:hypothetical protein
VPKCQPQWTYKGALNFGHKTGGAIQPLHPEAFHKVFKRVTTRKGKQTHGASFQARHNLNQHQRCIKYDSHHKKPQMAWLF